MASRGVGTYAKKVIVAIVVLILGISLGPTVVSLVQDVNTTGWDFTGYEAAETIIDLIPLLYYAGVLIGAGLSFLTMNSAKIYGFAVGHYRAIKSNSPIAF